MEMGAIGNALGADMNSDGEEILSMVVDMQSELEEAQADLAKEKTISKGWYENWSGVIAERDQLKAERDNLREDRDGLLEAGAHLL
jgi:chromosome segregation ATPase